MNRKYNLDAKRIYEEEFHVDLKGYSIEQVDAFLDKIIQDYQTYDASITELGACLKKYEAENIQLKNELRNLKNQLDTKIDNGVHTSTCDNLDIIKRLSNLEKEVFKNR